MARLDITLMPPPALGARPAAIIVGATGLVMLLAGLRFLALGAWPVLPFLAIDVGLLVWAFRASAIAARRYERLRLDDRGLTLQRVTGGGVQRAMTLPPVETSAELEELAPPDNRLWLRCRGRRIMIGRFLTPVERREVFATLRRALG